jgi:hypothetical protein
VAIVDIVPSYEDRSDVAKEEQRMGRQTEEDHLKRFSPDMLGWYSTLKHFILSLGEDTEIRSRVAYIAFRRRKGRKTLAYFNCYPTQNALVIDIPRPPGEVPSEPGFLSDVPGTKKGLILRMRVDSAADVERAKPHLERSYRES